MLPEASFAVMVTRWGREKTAPEWLISPDANIGRNTYVVSPYYAAFYI